MKKHLITGLVILLPLVLTILIARFVINMLTTPFAGIIHTLIIRFDILPRTIIIQYPQVIDIISVILALIFFLALIFAIGLLGRWYFFHTFIRHAEKVFQRIPFVNKIYKACKDVVQSLFQSEKGTFQTVVLVPYPYDGILSVGLVTQDALIQSKDTREHLVSVFVPATPNPTMGFILLFDKSQIIFTDMSIRQALQLLISCGSKVDNFGIVRGKES